MGIKELLRMEGREEGRKEGREELITTLLKNSGLSIRKIAEMLNLSEYYVRKIKKNTQLN